MRKQIPTYVINLKKRTERRRHVEAQFEGRKEFDLRIVEGFELAVGSDGLLKTMHYIISNLVPPDADYILLCEDDILFTPAYSPETLWSFIDMARSKSADLLLGGASWFESVVMAEDGLFWVNKFSGLHFTIIFRDFFSTILKQDQKTEASIDHHLATLSDRIFLIHPFLAIQREFGYSDVTESNNSPGWVSTMFDSTAKRLGYLFRVNELCRSSGSMEFTAADFDDMVIPTYIINLPKRRDRLEFIRSQFAGRSEFDVQIVEACENQIGAKGLWLSILKVIDLAVANDDDVILICEDDHEFTEAYSKEYLLKNIFEASYEGADFLSGGTGRFFDVVPVTENRYWADSCFSTQFIILFKDFFQKIRKYPVDDTIVADLVYSKIAVNKMLLYPFVSVQKNFGYSDITQAHTADADLVSRMFLESSLKLKQIQQAYMKFCAQTS